MNQKLIKERYIKIEFYNYDDNGYSDKEVFHLNKKNNKPAVKIPIPAICVLMECQFKKTTIVNRLRLTA